MVTGSLSGRVLRGRGGKIASAPVQLEGELKAEQPAVKTALRSIGARVDRDGTAEVQISGTLASPRLR